MYLVTKRVRAYVTESACAPRGVGINRVIGLTLLDIVPVTSPFAAIHQMCMTISTSLQQIPDDCVRES